MADCFAERLKRLRKARKISRKEFSERCGLSTTSIVRYEKGITNPRESSIIEMAKALNVSADFLSDEQNSNSGAWDIDADGLPVCSECGEIALQRVVCKLPEKAFHITMVKSKYCPSCGAKMEDNKK